MSGEAGRNYDCNDCKIDSSRRTVWGCYGKCTMATPTMVDESDGIIVKYWSCPVRFVPDSIWSFIKIRNFYNEHPSAPFPSYDKCSPRWLKAESIFNKELNGYMRSKYVRNT